MGKKKSLTMVTFRKTSFIITLCLMLTGCDPIQSKLDFYNNTSKAQFFQTFFIDKEDSTYRIEALLTKVNPYETKRVVSVVEMQTIFDMHNDSLLNVVIFNDYEFLEENSKIVKNPISDSLLRTGDYMVKRYTYSELEKKNWMIIYPDDGFEQGKPLIIDSKDEKSKPKPNPKILKEKGIEDRWNKRDSLQKK